jgi:hypothetical protein
VTRSVSMKEKMKESTGDNDGQSSGEFFRVIVDMLVGLFANDLYRYR